MKTERLFFLNKRTHKKVDKGQRERVHVCVWVCCEREGERERLNLSSCGGQGGGCGGGGGGSGGQE